jgi:hypothetical protein
LRFSNFVFEASTDPGAVTQTRELLVSPNTIKSAIRQKISPGLTSAKQLPENELHAESKAISSFSGAIWNNLIGNHVETKMEYTIDG